MSSAFRSPLAMDAATVLVDATLGRRTLLISTTYPTLELSEQIYLRRSVHDVESPPPPFFIFIFYLKMYFHAEYTYSGLSMFLSQVYFFYFLYDTVQTLLTVYLHIMDHEATMTLRQGQIQDGGGGGVRNAKYYVRRHTHHEHEARSHLWPGFRARLRALEALGVFDALSCYLSLILRHEISR